MRCHNHISDHSSYVGVCATCLRQRLIALIAAPAQSQSPSPSPLLQQDPPPLIFPPRSVSPYVSRRKSDDSTLPSTTLAYPHHRSYGAPQVGPTFTTPSDFPVKKRSSKFSLISNLFSSGSDKYNSGPSRIRFADSTKPTSSSSSSSWFFSTLLPSRRKKKSTLCYADDSTTNGRRPRRISNRGMSPARETESDEDCPWGRGDSTDEWRRMPMPGVRRTRTSSRGKNVSGLAFCLSPLVRASPIRQWNQKGGMAGALMYPVEGKPQLSAAASLCGNRSRKLADFGRVHHNR